MALLNIKGKTVMVAGGAGFVGSAIVRELLDDGAGVVVYDNFLHGTLANLTDVRDRVKIISGDILDAWRVAQAITENNVEFILSTVGDTYVPTAYDVPSRFFQINVLGCLSLLQATKQFNIKRYLYVSSTEVYGEAPTKKVTEKTELLPLNTYAVSKLAADRLCYTYHKEHDIPVICARIFNAYGPRETEPYVIPEIIAQLARGNVVRLGNIKAERDFTYVHDTARWLIDLMRSDAPFGEPVQVGSDNCYSIEWLAHKIADVMGVKNLKIEIDPRRKRRLDIERFQCDNTLLKKHIPVHPRWTIDEGLRLTVDWFNTHGKRWSWEDFVDGTAVFK
ncbi:MAG: GDP-mannose 4,6-dehydratase [Planctomycetes bacterium]|nr:GDP-mannose 4,6-dehydratase [Planctomycetota bacterium]